ncbi:bacteriophage DNA transposition protein A [Campylobacter pinnipediorum subsp. caledonicus]|uniref:Bacteriophage DNA transposition protein A n=1 Tax=Campylobacter pinnipediorum subsp. caledonicus TaxID=1874362 RepID=A0A1S6U7Z1_9BACT|nr:DDE-type integrase/transposase/recombinase [Campylobacter pinnipediorum]AQW85456.1 bacteriophage DNA transposition protein A [Campylobacter pinnipediorum subsp. caledonicus]AQW87871.1 bacteriophage DNA transposition protein A [Campylobacter pinnipediorum subsp. caledonicus]
MLYIETRVAAIAFNIGVETLKKSTQRNSDKYPFIRIKDVGNRSRGGVKLLFEASVADISLLVKNNKVDEDVGVYVFENNECKRVKFSEIKPQEKLSNNDNEINDVYLDASDEEIQDAREKREIIKEYEKAKMNSLSSKKFCEMLGISEASLFRWQKAYKNKGLRGLIDRRGKKKGSYKLDEWMKEFILTQFRAYGAGDFNVTQVWKDLHETYGKKTGKFNRYEFLSGSVKPLFDTGVISRFIKEYYANKRLEYTLITKGTDKATSYHDPAHGNQGIFVTRRNQVWQIDSSKLDVIVRDGKGGEQIRPSILSIIDVYSGRCVATLAETSNALSLVRLLWKAIKILGKPECIKGDNGKDYVSEQFLSLLEGIGIDYDAARAYHGRDKGYVERHFKTLQRSKLAHTPGYIGGSLAKRENIEQQTAKKERSAKDEYGHIVKTHQKNLLTYDDMKMRFETVVLEWDITAIKRKKTAPIVMWNSDNTPLKGLDYESFILYAGSKGILKVSKKGININGVHYVSRHLPSVGTSVRVSINIDNISEAFIFDLQGKFICKAKDSEVMSFSAEEFNAATKIFKDDLKAIRKTIKQNKISEFSRLNIEYDLKLAKEAHELALKKEDRIYDSSKIQEIKQKMQEQDEINKIKDGAFDYESYKLKENKTKHMSLIDVAIEKASGE